MMKENSKLLIILLVLLNFLMLSCTGSKIKTQAPLERSRTVSQERNPDKIYADPQVEAAVVEWSKAGKKPIAPPQGFQARGKASWYGPGLNGNKTANGEVFDMYTKTGAHKKLPFGSVVKVTNLRNQLFTFIRINDRGPFVKGRIIDLSYGAAHEIDMIKSGVEEVRLEIIRLGKAK